MSEQDYQVREQSPNPTLSRPLQPAIEENIQTRTVLCVDDEANILQALKRLLRKEGYAILTATSGEEGLEVLRQNPQVQVVISDQRMPGMKGSEFLLKVKNEYPDMIRIILTGYSEASAIMEAITESEVYHFMTKPWDDSELKATITQCFTYYHQRFENKLLIKKIQQQIQYLNVQSENDGNKQAKLFQPTDHPGETGGSYPLHQPGRGYRFL
jgi:response regulator RpfG family c-di-GMP phosphodiesterase